MSYLLSFFILKHKLLNVDPKIYILLSYSDQEDYEVVRKIGRGKYSEVFAGINSINNTKCVLINKLHQRLSVLKTLAIKHEYISNFSPKEQKEILVIIDQYASDFIKKWNDYFTSKL